MAVKVNLESKVKMVRSVSKRRIAHNKGKESEVNKVYVKVTKRGIVTNIVEQPYRNMERFPRDGRSTFLKRRDLL